MSAGCIVCGTCGGRYEMGGWAAAYPDQHISACQRCEEDDRDTTAEDLARAYEELRAVEDYDAGNPEPVPRSVIVDQRARADAAFRAYRAKHPRT